MQSKSSENRLEAKMEQFNQSNPRHVFLEYCTSSITDALSAEKNGAHRIEYCANLDQDGLTPSILEVQSLLDTIQIPVRVMIRPTNSFQVNDSEFSMMKNSIIQFKKLAIEGIVLGILDKNQRIDLDRVGELCQLVGSLPITFHKAIDASSKIIDDIQLLNQFKQIDTILSSGGKPTAWEGAESLNQFAKISNKCILAAGGITHQNLPMHIDKIQTNWFHGRRIVAI